MTVTGLQRDLGVLEQLAYLHGATLRIGASMDADDAILALCETAIPRLADFATAYLLDTATAERSLTQQQGSRDVLVRQVALAEDGWDQILVGKLPLHDLAGPFAETMSTGQTVVWPAQGEDRPPAGLGLLPSGWAGFLLIAPFRFDDQVQGFAALFRKPERGPFDDTDLLTATLMVDQTALSVHNAHLFQREAHIADALQRSMLPKSPPVLQGAEVAYRYLPSNPAAQVGGDWFDAIPLPGCRVALVIGDVMGHGVASAAAMGQLRTASRTLAALDLPPDQALRHLDDLARQLGENHLATCIYCVYDPVIRRCTIANAGHIPPVLVGPDGGAEIMLLPPGGPIGLGGIAAVAFESVEVAAPDDGLIVFCTDGLVESRSRDLDDGLARLRLSLTRPAPDLDRLCDDVLEALHTEEREDDVALLAARFQGIPSENVAQWIMRPHPMTASQVRGLIRTTLEGWGLAEHCDIAELLATELVSNAIRYASRPIKVRLMRTEALLCEVSDDDHRLPVLREPGENDEGGRGLYLVSHLARRWGASRTTSGKTVWFEIALR
jgi:serine phosphatase RsbU (regulator of sigma subunit)